MTQLDKATPQYWSQLWQNTGSAGGSAAERATYLHTLLAQFFSEQLRDVPSGSLLLEVGCAGSEWLPHLARHHGLRIAGLDYSEVGCEAARAILQREGVAGTVYCADVLAPPPQLLRQCDVVLSTGVIEHFSDTTSIVGAIARLARPGGLILTTVPNLAGWLGTVQQRLDRAVYDKHVPLRLEDVRTAHEQAGLEVLRCSYIGTLDFHLCNLNGTDVHSVLGRSKRLGLQALMRFSRLVWWGEKRLGAIPPTRHTAAGVVCAARVPA